MARSNKRRNGANKVHRTSAEVRREYTNHGSLKELLALQQKARDVEVRAADQVGSMLAKTRKYVGQIDGRYVSSLLTGAAAAVGALGTRLNGYAELIDAMHKNGGDISGAAMGLLADFSDEQLTIDTNIYKPLYDVQCEINKYASEDDRINLMELEDFIHSFDESFTVGEQV